MKKTLSIGIDLGSISLKLVLLDGKDDIVFSKWVRVAGQPLKALSELLIECAAAHPQASVASIGATGSGRQLLEEILPCRAINEISAHAAAIDLFHPGVRTIIEIGGQDSKLIIMEESEGSGTRPIRDFSMNELCAAGTGAFLDQQAARLGITIDDFARLAEGSNDPAPIAGRCAVFAKTDMTHFQQEGRPLADIVAGLNDALARSYMANLVRGRNLPGPIAFQGGVASNTSLVWSFRKILGAEGEADLIVPKHHKVMGAIGAAIKGRSLPSQSRPFDIVTLERIATRFQDGTAPPDAELTARASPLARPRGESVAPDFTALPVDGRYLGIDVGSVSVKFVLIGPDGILDADYAFSDGRPVDVLREMLARFLARTDPTTISGVGVTGSGRHFIGRLAGADAITNEISAQALAASLIYPKADTVFEIGGQDAKFLRVEGGRAKHFAMNRVCAAGTGAFLQEQAKRLEVDLEEEFSALAFESVRPAALGARCTVFMESDLVSHQQMGFEKRDLIAALARSVVANYMEKVVAGHPIGEHALFLGGVAENEAVVAALESEIGRPVATTSLGKLSGAIGAALAATGRIGASGRDKPFTVSDAALEYETFTCSDCPNSCRVCSTSTDPVRYFGGRCGKWDGRVANVDRGAFSPIRLRSDLLFRPGNGGAKGGPRVGIPRALMAYDMLPAWRTFFERLGCEVVLSPATDEEILSSGIKRLVVETCLPIKSFCSHVAWFDGAGVDFIFVPSVVITGKDLHGKETAHCPYIQSLAQFARPVTDTPLLNPVINWKLDPRSEARAMASLAPMLGRSKRKGSRAWKAACLVQREFRSRIKEVGEYVMKSLRDGSLDRAFVVLGKDYNVLDERLSSGAMKILESRGEVAITQDMLVDDLGKYSKAYRTMYWTHGKEILAASHRAHEIPNLYPVLITSFGCGPDSFTIKFAKDIAGDKPMLLLEVDEHTSPVGIETRIEAFLDSLDRGYSPSTCPNRPGFSPKAGIRRVFLPNFSDHGYAFAAALKGLGFTPVLTELPDDESAKLGARFASSGECHPYVLMLGDFLKAARDGHDLTDACYFMPESGACRVGQFGTQMRLAAEEMGVTLPVYTRIEDLVASKVREPRLAYLKTLATYWEMMRAMDFLMQKHLEVRAYEAKAGAADAARAEGHRQLMACIMDGQPLEGIKRAINLLNTIPLDRAQRKVRIGITGDYYTRICDYANGGMFRDIERMGGVVMLPPTMSDFVKYDSRQKPWAAIRHGNAFEFALTAAMRWLVDTRERRARSIFADELDYDVPLEYNRAEKLLAPYMDMRLPAGLTGSVAAILEQMRAGADGIVSTITFHCSYGLAIGTTMSMIGRDHPDVPMLTLIFEGLKPTHNRLRLEAFMERVHEKASRRRSS